MKLALNILYYTDMMLTEAIVLWYVVIAKYMTM